MPVGTDPENLLEPEQGQGTHKTPHYSLTSPSAHFWLFSEELVKILQTKKPTRDSVKYIFVAIGQGIKT